MTRLLALLALLLGVALLAVVVHQADLPATWSYLVRLGWWGLGAILAVSVAGLACEAVSWLLTFAAIPATPRWWRRVARVLVVGEALELLAPVGALTGDSAKAILLRRRYGVSLREATTSLVLSRTTDIISLVVFIALGLALMVQGDHLPAAVQASAVAGLVALAALGGLFVAAQWQRPVARLTRWLASRATPRRLPTVLARVVAAVRDVEDRLVAFYRAHAARLLLSAIASFAEWVSGAYVTYLALGFFGTPVTLAEAVVIESLLLLVRSTLFFVPADLGTQDGALVVTCAAITGSASAGLALAAVRRARDLLVIGGGLALGMSAWSAARAAPVELADVRGDDAR